MVITSRYKQNQIANEQHDHTNQGTDHQGILDIAEFHVFTSCSSKRYRLLGLTLPPHRAYCVSRSTRRICSEGNSRLLPPDPPGADCSGRDGREGGLSAVCIVNTVKEAVRGAAARLSNLFQQFERWEISSDFNGCKVRPGNTGFIGKGLLCKPGAVSVQLNGLSKCHCCSPRLSKMLSRALLSRSWASLGVLRPFRIMER